MTKISKLILYSILLTKSIVITSCSTTTNKNIECYHYEKVTISGKLISLSHPNGKGDYWVLKTKPFCTQIRPDEELYEPFEGQTEIHLAMGNLYSTYRHLLGKRVKVYGNLYSRHTGHHLRKVLISVDKIEEAK